MFKYWLYVFVTLIHTPSLFGASELDTIIPPKVQEDYLYKMLYLLAKNEHIKTILEIGSSSGNGSTEALVLGAIQNDWRPTLYCIEISRPRFNILQSRYCHLPTIKLYNVSSIPLSEFPTEDEVILFLVNNMKKFDFDELDAAVEWHKRDLEYAQRANVPENGIELIKKENNIEQFDMVFIDGSDFTGSVEFKLIYGARIIVLDDIYTFKNYANYLALMNDPLYERIQQNDYLRNGYAVFKKRSE